MEANEVIERLCKLQEKVARHVGFEHASDCFCGKSGYWGCDGYGGTYDEGYRNDGKALEFIENAVNQALSKGNTDNE